MYSSALAPTLRKPNRRTARSQVANMRLAIDKLAKDGFHINYGIGTNDLDQDGPYIIVLRTEPGPNDVRFIICHGTYEGACLDDRFAVARHVRRTFGNAGVETRWDGRADRSICIPKPGGREYPKSFFTQRNLNWRSA